MRRRKSLYDSTAQTETQQHVVEHGEHDKAQQKSWSSTASGLSSRCLDTVLPLDQARSGRESEVDYATLPYYNIIPNVCHPNQQHTVTTSTYMQVMQKALWRWATGEKKVREKSRECYNHKPQPFPDINSKRKPTNPNTHKSIKHK